MHRELKGLPERVVLDTNLLFDAAFVRGGLAQEAVVLLRELGYSPVIDMMIEEEAGRVLNRKTKSLGLAFNPIDELNAFIRGLPVIVLPPAAVLPVPEVKKHDRHVARAAKDRDAWVLTGDAALVAECEDAGIGARFPWDVIVEAERKKDPNPTLQQIFRSTPMSRESVYIFARLTTFGWTSSRVSSQHQVCDFENVGRIYYDSDFQQWVFEMPIGVTARVKCPIADEETWAVCGSYSLPGGGKTGRIVIRAGKHPSTICKAETQTTEYLAADTTGRGTGPSHGHGVVYARAFVTGRQGMGDGQWKAIVRIPDAAPNPYDANALDGVLRAKQAMLEAHKVTSLDERHFRHWLATRGMRP